MYTDLVSQHQVKQSIAVDQNDLRAGPAMDKFLGAACKGASRNEHPLRHTLSRECADEGLYLLPGYDVVRLVAFCLDHDLVQSQWILVDAPVNPFITALTQMLRGGFPSAAVPHRH